MISVWKLNVVTIAPIIKCLNITIWTWLWWPNFVRKGRRWAFDIRYLFINCTILVDFFIRTGVVIYNDFLSFWKCSVFIFFKRIKHFAIFYFLYHFLFNWAIDCPKMLFFWFYLKSAESVYLFVKWLFPSFEFFIVGNLIQKPFFVFFFICFKSV